MYHFKAVCRRGESIYPPLILYNMTEVKHHLILCLFVLGQSSHLSHWNTLPLPSSKTITKPMDHCSVYSKTEGLNFGLGS